MFIKLTRFDNSLVWLNAAFVVTVEPRKNAPGSIVVPIGDGLDYEVRENPDEVLALLANAPTPTVVPVPAPEGLTHTPEDVSPEPESPEPEPEKMSTSEAPKAKPVKKSSRVRKTATGGDAPVKKAKTVHKAKKAVTTLSNEQIERLRKMAPGSVRKLQNTLLSQFMVADANAEIAGLADKGVLALDRDHVVWSK